jgi:hypothetical protein
MDTGGVDVTLLHSDLSDFKSVVAVWNKVLGEIGNTIPGGRYPGYFSVTRARMLELGDRIVKTYNDSIAPRLKQLPDPPLPPLSFL